MIQIRKATITDAANIAAISHCVWIDTYATRGLYDNVSKYMLAELTEEKLKNIILTHAVFVATENAKLFGYMVLEPPNDNGVEIATLYILPRFQGQGIGKQFINHAKNIAGCTLWLSVWEENVNAIGFYQKFGFQQNGELFFDLYGDPIRNIVFELKF